MPLDSTKVNAERLLSYVCPLPHTQPAFLFISPFPTHIFVFLFPFSFSLLHLCLRLGSGTSFPSLPKLQILFGTTAQSDLLIQPEAGLCRLTDSSALCPFHYIRDRWFLPGQVPLPRPTMNPPMGILMSSNIYRKARVLILAPIIPATEK